MMPMTPRLSELPQISCLVQPADANPPPRSVQRGVVARSLKHAFPLGKIVRWKFVSPGDRRLAF